MSCSAQHRHKAFTLLETLAAVAIIAVLLAVMVPQVANFVAAAERESDKQTLTVLNDAINRYKMQGGDVTALTSGKAFNKLLTTLRGPIGWNGVSHQFIKDSENFGHARTIAATYDGKRYRLTRFNTYSEGAGNTVSLDGAAAEPTAWTVSNLAGSTLGYTDATGAAAQFYFPYGVATDSSGNIYVADASNSVIRKVTPAGVVTTLAGSTYGYADGTGAAAQFAVPYSVAVDGAGNVYVADKNNHRIRKVTPAGVVTTLAGSTMGFANATGASARFSSPTGIAVDSAGNVYVGDRSNHRIRKVTSTGVVTTLAGSTSGYTDDTGTAAQFSSPTGVAVDSTGNVYVADYSNNRIRKITSGGVVTTLAGSTSGYTDGTGATAQFTTPDGVTVDTAGNVYVADTGNHRIRKVTPAGVVTTLAGSTSGNTNGVGATAQFNLPRGIAIDSAGNIYVADGNNQRIRKLTPQY